MRKLLVIMACAALLCGGVTSRADDAPGGEVAKEKKETKAERKAREKRMEAIADSLAHLDALFGLDSRYFVITADRMSIGKRGHSIEAPDESLNFIMVQGDKATIQLVPRYTRTSGFNGLGGITVEGTLTGVRRGVTKKGDVTFNFGVLGTAVSAQVYVTLSRDSNKAEAYITPNFNSQRMIIYGPLIPYDHSTGESRAFVGTPLP